MGFESCVRESLRHRIGVWKSDEKVKTTKIFDRVVTKAFIKNDVMGMKGPNERDEFRNNRVVLGLMEREI